jgi:quinol monooxygenase YgiN
MTTVSTRWSIDRRFHPEDKPMRYVQNFPACAFARSGFFLAACLVAAALAGTPALAQSGGDALYAVTYVGISPDWILQGGGALKQYRDQSRKEAGNLEFDVMQETDRPDQFMIVEGWKDEAAFKAHEKGAGASLFNFTLQAIRTAPPNQFLVRPFATAPARTMPAGTVVHMVEHVDIIPPRAAEVQPALKALAEATQKEPGAVRYDIYQVSAPRTNHFAIVGVWTDAKAYDAHEASAQTKAFRAATAPPVRGNLYDQRLYKEIQ